MDTKYFSLDTATGTARAIVYWDRLSEQQKASILFTAHQPDPSFLEMILQEGNPLLIEIAFRGLLACNFRRSQFKRYIDLVPRAIDVIENQWNKRLGFTPWSEGACPVNLASDFYTWVRGEVTDEPCAEIEAWANGFCTQSQLQRKVIVERSLIFISVGLLAACLRKGKLSAIEAFELFKVVIANHRDRYYEKDEEWRLTWDDGVVLSSFLSSLAIAEKDDYVDESWSLLAACISALSNFVILEESVEPFLAMHPRSLTLMLLMKGGTSLSVLRRRLIELVLREDENACPPSVRLGIFRSDDGWDDVLSQCSKRSEALRFALGMFPVPQQWREWGFTMPKDYWLRCGIGLLSSNSGEEWVANLDLLDDIQRKVELAEMACLCEAMVASGGQGYDGKYQSCDSARSSFDYSQDEAVVAGDIVSTYENLLRRDPYGRRGGQWRKWRIHMDRKYGRIERLVASA